jgi:O-antigen ligase
MRGPLQNHEVLAAAPRRAAVLLAGVVSAAVGYVVAAAPSLVAPIVGLGVAAALLAAPAEVFLGLAVLARNLSDAAAHGPSFAGFNAGALVGLLALGVAGLRLLVVPRPRGILGAFTLVLLLVFWLAVGVVNFGLDPEIQRELVRSTSIIALALVALAAPAVSAHRIVDAVLLATSVPAIVALGQLVRRDGFENTDRVYGTLAHPNAAAAIFGVGLAVALWRMLETRRRRYLVAAAMFAVAMLATKSLGGVAQMFVTLVAYAFLTRRRDTRGAVTAAVAIALAVVFVLSPLGSDRVGELSSTTSPTQAIQGNQTNSVDWRFANWIKLIEAWQEKPVLGWGLGTTETLVVPGENIPHSDVVRLLVETGVVGFLVFGAAYAALLVALYRRVEGAGSVDARFCAVVLAVVLGLTAHGFANNISTQTATMYAAAVLVALALAVPTRPPDEAPAAGRG